MTPEGLRFCPTGEIGAVPVWLTKIGQAILNFFKAIGPAAVQAAIASGRRIVIQDTGDPAIRRNGDPNKPPKPPQIVLTPEMARQWLTLFCQFGLLPRENCAGVIAQPSTPPPTPPAPPPSERWWEKIPTPVWIALAVIGTAILVRQLR